MMNPIVFITNGLDFLTQSSAAVYPEENAEHQGQLF